MDSVKVLSGAKPATMTGGRRKTHRKGRKSHRKSRRVGRKGRRSQKQQQKW